jgi:hypothetical protein
MDLTVCVASWHSGLTVANAEGGLALYIVPPGGDPSISAHFTVKAYGGGGVVRSVTSPFFRRYNVFDNGYTYNSTCNCMRNHFAPPIQRLNWTCPACIAGNPESGSVGYSEAQIRAVGFRFGANQVGQANYFYSSNTMLTGYYPSNAAYKIFMHQCATIADVACPAKYKIDYDDTPSGGVQPKSALSLNFASTGGLETAVFQIHCDGSVFTSVAPFAPPLPPHPPPCPPHP